MLKTVGIMSKSELNVLLGSFPEHPQLEIMRMESVIAVTMRGKKILSAITGGAGLRSKWHVMALPGLVDVKLADGVEFGNEVKND